MNKCEQVYSDHQHMSVAGGPQMNKFEQVSTDHQLMSLVGDPKFDAGKGGGLADRVQTGNCENFTFLQFRFQAVIMVCNPI